MSSKPTSAAKLIGQPLSPTRAAQTSSSAARTACCTGGSSSRRTRGGCESALTLSTTIPHACSSWSGARGSVVGADLAILIEVAGTEIVHNSNTAYPCISQIDDLVARHAVERAVDRFSSGRVLCVAIETSSTSATVDVGAGCCASRPPRGPPGGATRPASPLCHHIGSKGNENQCKSESMANCHDKISQKASGALTLAHRRLALPKPNSEFLVGGFYQPCLGYNPLAGQKFPVFGPFWQHFISVSAIV